MYSNGLSKLNLKTITLALKLHLCHYRFSKHRLRPEYFLCITFSHRQLTDALSLSHTHKRIYKHTDTNTGPVTQSVKDDCLPRILTVSSFQFSRRIDSRFCWFMNALCLHKHSHFNSFSGQDLNAFACLKIL